MSKNLVVKLVISLIFVAFIYTLFWFFKVGQLEKRIAKFIDDNSSYISASKIESYGFPLSQNIVIKDIKFRIPNPILNKRQIAISELQAKAAIFDSNFVVTLPKGISTQNSQGEIARVIFNAEPNVNVNIIDSTNVSLSYQDNGYNLHGPNKDLVLAAKSSNITLSINSADKNHIKVKIDSNISGIEGFDVIDIYNNILQEEIAKGIQTGKIKVGSSQIIEEVVQPNIVAPENSQAEVASPEVTKQNLNAQIAANETVPASDVLQDDKIEIQQLAQGNTQEVALQEEATEALQVVVEESKTDDTTTNVANSTQQESVINPEFEKVETVEIVKPADNVVKDSPSVEESSPEVISPKEDIAQQDLGLKNQYTQGVTSNLKIDILYILMPNNTSNNLDLPFDPTQVQELPVQYNKEIKVNNFEFSNANYQILSNGSLKLLADDTMPSGMLTLIVQNHDNFITYLRDYIKYYLESKGYNINPVKKSATEIVVNEIENNIESQAPETPSSEMTPEAPALVEAPEVIIKDEYDNFLKKIHDRLVEVSTEISEKNPASTNEESRYEIKREKNLEFKINDTPVREVLGKF